MSTMIASNDDEGLLAKNQAYKNLKKIMGIKRGVPIKREFFFMFYHKEGEGLFRRKLPELVEKEISEKANIKALNDQYYELKKKGSIAEAQTLYEGVIKFITEVRNKKNLPN